MVNAEIVPMIAAIHEIQSSRVIVVVPRHTWWTASQVWRVLGPIKQRRIPRKNVFPESRVCVHPLDQCLVSYAELHAVASKQLVVWKVDIVE